MFGTSCTVFWKQFLSDFYAMKLSILIWNPGEVLASQYSMAKHVFFSLNCDQIPSSEIQSLVLKPCNYPRWPIMAMAPNNFKSFTTTHPVKSCSCLQSPHYPIFQVLLAFCSTKYSASTINNDANIAHKSKTSREENPLWKKNIAQAGKQAVHLYTCCLSVSSLYWVSK